MSKLRFPVVIHPKATKLEYGLFIFLIAFIFIPFIYGVITSQAIYCWSLVLGILGIGTFNYFTDFKFTDLKIIQKNKFINFNEEEISFEEDGNLKIYKWDELEEIEINVFAYKNKSYGEDSYYSGMENNVKFKKDSIEFEYLFYIEKVPQFNFIQDYFEKIVLPKLYALKNIKNETVIISELDYSKLQEFKREKSINRYTDQIYFNS